LLFIPIALYAEDADTIILTAKEIRETQALKMADVLNNVPGIKAGDSSVSIHGSYKVKVFVDGRPINDPTSSYGGINWDIISPDEVKQIEILRGKGGLRYGQDAAGGVILITTKSLQRQTLNIKTYGGNNDTAYAYANLQMTTGNWALGITGAAEDTDGYKINNDKKQRQTGAKIAYIIDDVKNLSLSADYLEDDRGLSGLPEYPTPFSRKSTHTTNLSLQGCYNNLTSTSFFNDGSNHNTDHSRNLNQKLRVLEWGENLTATIVTKDWVESILGGGYRMGKANSTSFDNKREETYSAFVSQSLKWLKYSFEMTLGLRADINSAFDDAINPEIKATYKNTHWRITTAYGRSNNTPSFHQRYNRTSSTLPNPNLSMETSDNYSIAFFIEPYDFVSGSISLFYNCLSDRITYVTDDYGMGSYQNFNKVTYKGGDLALAWRPCKWLNIKSGYTYMEAKDKQSGLWIPAKAKHQANLDFYCNPTDMLSIVLSNKYTSKVFRNKNNTKTVPEYSITDLRAEYAFKRFSLFTKINNIFDKNYYYADGLLAPPLSWIVGINVKI